MRLIEIYKMHHPVFWILSIGFIISFVYEIITLKHLETTIMLTSTIIVMGCFEGFFKK